LRSAAAQSSPSSSSSAARSSRGIQQPGQAPSSVPAPVVPSVPVVSGGS
jgi:hypothetical protein